MTTSAPAPGVVRSLIPARIDRLPWSPFHTRMVIALGVAWILDGLEITVASSVTDVLTKPETLALSSTAAGLVASVYLAGEVVGALFFGRLSDKLGRRNLFMITLGVYLVGSGLTAFTLGNGPFWIGYLYLTRFIAGMGIGGEYAAINSAIDELIPSRYRGRVDIMVNGTYWAGAILGTLGSLIFLNVLSLSVGWRIAFLIGPVLGLVILFVRRHLPESPRWQVMNGRERQAEESISYIEHEVEQSGVSLPKVDESKALELQPTTEIGYLALTRVLFRDYPSRAVLGASLMITQSFLYNAIFFTYTLVLSKFYGVPSTSAPVFLIAFAVGNLAGPAHDRAPVRHDRPPEDDRGHLRAVRAAAGHHGVPVQRGRAQRRHPDDRLVHHLLLRLGRCQRRLPDGQRDLPAGGAVEGDRRVLRHRAVLRRDRPGDLRRADRRRLAADQAVLRLPARCRHHDHRWGGGVLPRGRRRGQVRSRTSRRRSSARRTGFTRAEGSANP